MTPGGESNGKMVEAGLGWQGGTAICKEKEKVGIIRNMEAAMRILVAEICGSSGTWRLLFQISPKHAQGMAGSMPWRRTNEINVQFFLLCYTCDS